jgi:hypothetical protein
MRLRVYDPHAFQFVNLDEAAYGKAVGDYVPVRSPRTGKWFAVYFPSNEAHKLEDLNDTVRSVLEREAKTCDLTENLCEACKALRVKLTEAEPMDRRQALEHFGAFAATVARAKARKQGFTDDEVDRGMGVLLGKGKMLEAVETIRVSTLVENV